MVNGHLLFLLSTLVFVLGTLSVWLTSTPMAQVREFQNCTVLSGEYRDLTWYRTVKLGLAPFVEPALAKKTAVVNIYPVERLYGHETRGILMKLDHGELWPAIRTEQGYTTLQSDNPIIDALAVDMNKKETSTYSDASVALAQLKEKIVFVGALKSLAALEPAGRAVAWETGAPVVARARQPCLTVSGRQLSWQQEDVLSK